MADEMVLRAQRFVNTTYNNGATLGISKLEENGRTSWTVMYALTRALQHEMGITALSNNFGPTTLRTLQSKYPKLDASTVPSANFCRIIQSALYCKGYDGGEIDGKYNSRVEAGVTALKTNMGVDRSFPGGGLEPKVVKGLLNMDAYVVVSGGSESIRGIQQWLNWRYVDRQDFYLIPCDGHNSRDVSKSMLLAIQYELGMADGVANGVFGPGTQAGLKQHTVAAGTTGTWASLFTAAMILNRRPVPFGNFTATVKTETERFQSFVKLPVTGIGDFSTWASLLVSYGDQSRRGEACDGVTKITPARAETLKAHGITYVGRYLTNPDPTPSGSTAEKAIQPGELQTIADNGLRCYPIYQTYGRGADGFSYPLGRAAAQAAINAALDHGFRRGTRIYFAVDFDALDYQVTNDVLPHFKGIEDAVADDGNRFEIGVYGPRNVCTRVGEAGHSTASFVSDMSSGFSGNFGYPLPPDWAYDQIVTRTIGSGAGAINLDNNIASGRDTGQGSFDPPRAIKADVRLDSMLVESMMTDVGKYMESIGYPNDGGTRTYQHWKCFDTICVEHDELITSLSNRHNLRKALIQATAYWEMRHIDPVDEAAELAVISTFNTTGKFLAQDPSTGIAQQRAQTLIPAWNHALDKGYATGQPYRDPASDQDKYDVWKKARDDEEFALTSVVMIDRWDIDGKPGGDDDSPALRQPTLSYTDKEIYEVLRRYQGPFEPAFTDAKKRMPLYYVLEKYHSISRNM
ncbi:glycoside hydrolase domain-containing protein [Streptomyces sp. NPDC059906]|uniref:glycoside hydrolase domain-containing protein n=1 Tax=Streptomyces sp. NPDC059906 TaxID=3346997 RepID=UPI003663AA75